MPLVVGNASKHKLVAFSRADAKLARTACEEEVLSFGAKLVAVLMPFLVRSSSLLNFKQRRARQPGR